MKTIDIPGRFIDGFVQPTGEERRCPRLDVGTTSTPLYRCSMTFECEVDEAIRFSLMLEELQAKAKKGNE